MKITSKYKSIVIGSVRKLGTYSTNVEIYKDLSLKNFKFFTLFPKNFDFMSQNFLSTQFLVNTHLEDVPNVNVHWTFTFHLKNLLWKRLNDFQVGSTQIIPWKYNTINALPTVRWIHTEGFNNQPVLLTVQSHSPVLLRVKNSYCWMRKKLILRRRNLNIWINLTF